MKIVNIAKVLLLTAMASLSASSFAGTSPSDLRSKVTSAEYVYLVKFDKLFRKDAKRIIYEEISARQKAPARGTFCDISEIILILNEERMLLSSIARSDGLFSSINACYNLSTASTKRDDNRGNDDNTTRIRGPRSSDKPTADDFFK